MGEEKSLSLSLQLLRLADEIHLEINHGECFYEEDMFKEFIKLLDKTKEVGKLFFEKNNRGE